MGNVREDLKEKNIRKLPGLVKRTKKTKKEVWRSLVRASSSAQSTEEKKEEEGNEMNLPKFPNFIQYYTQDNSFVGPPV